MLRGQRQRRGRQIVVTPEQLNVLRRVGKLFFFVQNESNSTEDEGAAGGYSESGATGACPLIQQCLGFVFFAPSLSSPRLGFGFAGLEWGLLSVSTNIFHSLQQ